MAGKCFCRVITDLTGAIMTATTFDVSPDVTPKALREKIDHARELQIAFRRPLEACWQPDNQLIVCNEQHALLSALKVAFFDHMPLRLSPDAIWITLARGFALHVNKNAEQLRSRFVGHLGKAVLQVTRLDFMPGADNPWPEAFEAFNQQLEQQTGGLASLLSTPFSTTGPLERTVSHLMAMDTFKAYFEYELEAGCGIPRVTLTGTSQDWQLLRRRAHQFAEYGLERWVRALDPVLAAFERSKDGCHDLDFWRSMYRYHSGSGPAVMTGWINVLFPYFQDAAEQLYENPYLFDWEQRLRTDDAQHFRERWGDPQGVGMAAVPPCFTSVPLKVSWGQLKTDMRIAGGLMGVTQDEHTLDVEPVCGWALMYEAPVVVKTKRHRPQVVS